MKKYGIFGNPVAHSKSPNMHNSAFNACRIDAHYDKYLVKDAKDLRAIFEAENLQGVNITVPYKEDAFRQADEVRGIAKEIGAVNTWIKEDDKIIGYNTDAVGFYDAIQSFGEIKTVLLIGAGGTAKAIALYLHAQGIKVELLNRSEQRLEFFNQQDFTTYTWESFVSKEYDLVINSTSAGLSDDNLPVPTDIMDDIFLDTTFAIDCVYGKETPFLKMAKKLVVDCKDGEDMLLYQGVKAYELFTQGRCEDDMTDVMRKSLRS